MDPKKDIAEGWSEYSEVDRDSAKSLVDCKANVCNWSTVAQGEECQRTLLQYHAVPKDSQLERPRPTDWTPGIQEPDKE